MINLKKGFTLIEVIVALSILGIAVTVILQVFSSNLKSLSRSEDYVKSLVVAEAKLKELILQEDLEEKQWTETSPLGYRFDILINEVLKERTETLQFRLLEIQLTIRWMWGNKEKYHTLKTLKAIPKKSDDYL
ncbi:MAG: prepilin-type N-terminal cleavage/methylation domain-containing protein [Thermodesulfovibrionales bacterium]|nr:prepilin-type N-terminal cleavage/methylation domain-containing protein [Thermodesulfovibrionales bacterium]